MLYAVIHAVLEIHAVNISVGFYQKIKNRMKRTKKKNVHNNFLNVISALLAFRCMKSIDNGVHLVHFCICMDATISAC